jgi:hypothetical protein
MLIHMDSFDVYKSYTDLTFQYIIDSTSSFGVGTQSGRFLQGAYFTDRYSSYLQKNFNSNYSEIWTGIAINTYDAGGVPNPPDTISFSGGDKAAFTFQSNSGWEGMITYNNFLGVWKFWTHTPSVGTPISIYNGEGIFQTGTLQWHWVDIHYKASSVSTGIVEVWVDDTQIMNLTGLATTSWGGSSINGIYLGSPGLSLSPAALFSYWDDWYVLDATTGEYNTTRLGDSRIYSQIPVSDVAGHNDGIPSFGTNYFAMVDEPQNDGLTTYITIQGISGQEDIFNMSSIPAQPPTIYGNRVLNIIEQTAGGTIAGNAIIVSSGTQASGNAQPLLNTFFSQFGIFEVDPNTNVPWTWEDINAAQCGFKVTNT